MVYESTPLRKRSCGTLPQDCGVMVSMTAPTAITGSQGEAIAAAYLRRNGYRILERNVRFGRYEIDIVAEDVARGMIVFVEVKARTQFDAAYPIRTAVDRRKRRALREAIARWVNLHVYEGAGRTDVISVADGVVVEHLLDLGADFF